MSIINLADNDVYKDSMAAIYTERYPGIQCRFKLINRRPTDDLKVIAGQLRESIESWGALTYPEECITHLASYVPIGETYAEYLRNLRLDPGVVDIRIVNDTMQVYIEGTLAEASRWEVPLMAEISRLFLISKYGGLPASTVIGNHAEVEHQAYKKGVEFKKYDCRVAEFGTRRRRSPQVQEAVIRGLAKSGCLVGISNVHFAQKFGFPLSGTVAHEFYMMAAVMHSMNRPNRYAMREWMEFWKGSCGAAISDTFGTASFLKDFDFVLANGFSSIKHDSGDPIKFVNTIVGAYEERSIDPATKTIIFSDSLNLESAIRIREHVEKVGKGIKAVFGIGTFLTNDFPGQPALNIVIKLDSVEGVPAVKLSDDPGKACGDPEMVAIMKKVHYGIPIYGK